VDPIISGTGSWLTVLGSVGLLLAGHLARKYIIPFLQIGKRQRYAQFIAAIADEVTDDLRNRYPQRAWLKHLDEAIDALVAICGVSSEIARRAVNAAVARK
jgi:hypothetical protein